MLTATETRMVLTRRLKSTPFFPEGRVVGNLLNGNRRVLLKWLENLDEFDNHLRVAREVLGLDDLVFSKSKEGYLFAVSESQHAVA